MFFKNKVIISMFLILLCVVPHTFAATKGDLTCDDIVDLSDAIIALQITEGQQPDPMCNNDVNMDLKIDLVEAVYALHFAADIRTDTVTLTGQVTGSGGLNDVQVTAGGAEAYTDENGFYRLMGAIPGDNGRLVITFEKDGYATYQRSLDVIGGNIYAVSAKLAVYLLSEQSVDQTTEQTLEARDGGNVLQTKLVLPANSLKDAAEGNVKVSITAGDPTTEDGAGYFPGDYMAGPGNGADPDTPLDSVSFTEITITDANGNEITELTEPATLTVRLPDAFQTGGEQAGTYSAGDTIPWWSYDETSASWVREDANPSTPDVVDDALIVDIGGELYAQAMVTHFTWWNVDAPINQHACICVTVVDKDGNPMPNVEVVARGVTYNGTSRPALTNRSGFACVTVKRSQTGGSPEIVEIFVRHGSLEFPYAVTDAGEGVVGTNQVYTPDYQGSTVTGQIVGDCMTLMNDLVVAFNGQVTGTVTYENSNPAQYFTIYSDFGPTATTNELGQYELDVPNNLDILLYAPGLVSQTVNVPDPPNDPATVDFVIPNQDPIIDIFLRNPEGRVDPGAQVDFFAQAHDPDGDAVSYSWTASAGAPTSAAGSLFPWIAPTTPDTIGTAVVELTVTDALGGSTSQQMIVVWGGGPTITTLDFLIKDNPVNNQPVAGVHVILHGADNKSVLQDIVTPSTGVASFGDIGRNLATFTIAYYGPENNNYAWTFEEVPVGNIVFYVDQGENFGYQGSYCETATTINITAVNVPQDTSSVRVRPTETYMQQPTFTAAGSVCPSHVQYDGNISLLAEATKWDSQTYKSVLLGYGFILDQPYSEGSGHQIDLNRTPMTVSWFTYPPEPISSIGINAERGGVGYYWENYNSTQEQTSYPKWGTFQFPNEFPVDSYWVTFSAGEQVAETQRLTKKKYDTMPSSMSAAIPDMRILDLSYNDQTQTYSWGYSGNMNKDTATVYFWGGDTAGTYNIIWTVQMDGSKTDWTKVDLPTALQADFSFQWTEVNTVEVSDLDVFSGFDDVWYAYLLGNDPYDMANVIYSAKRYLYSNYGDRSRKTPETKPLSGFSGLLRR